MPIIEINPELVTEHDNTVGLKGKGVDIIPDLVKELIKAIC